MVKGQDHEYLSSSKSKTVRDTMLVTIGEAQLTKRRRKLSQIIDLPTALDRSELDRTYFLFIYKIRTRAKATY